MTTNGTCTYLYEKTWMHRESIYSEGQTSEIERRTKIPRPTVRRTDSDVRWISETKMRRDSDLGTQTVDGT